MGEMWSYEKTKYFDNKGKRWHFVNRYFFGTGTDFGNHPFEVYFRDDERTEFGLLRFEKRNDNPYRNYEMLANKIMNNEKFRKSLLNPELEEVWNRNWK